MKYIINTFDKSKLMVGLFAASLLIVAASSICILFTGQSNTTGHQLLSKLQADFAQSYTTRDLKASLDFSGHSMNGQLSESVEKGTRFSFASTPVATSEQPPPQLMPFPQGAIYAMGANTNGQLGIGTGIDTNVPVQLVPVNQWGGPVAVGSSHMLLADSESVLWVSGSDISGQLGNGAAAGSVMTITKMASASEISSVACGASHSLVVSDRGDVYGSGSGTLGQLGNGGTDTDIFSAIMTDAYQASASGNNSFVVKKNGSLWAFGENASGQLGTGDASIKVNPVQVDPAGVVSVATGTTHTIYLMDDGAVFAMGMNSFGQFGDGTTDSSLSPKLVISSGVKQIAAGNGFSLFRMEDGSLKGVGLNSSGQLGTGDTAVQNSLVTIAASGVSDIAAGNSHAMFVKNDGTLWGMGANSNGQLGTGDFSPRLTVTQVPGAANVADVTAGFNSTLFMTRTLSQLIIDGLDYVYENDKVNFECYAEWSDGRLTKVTAEAVWTENSPYASFMQNAGVLAATAGADGMITITVSYHGQQANKMIHIEHLPLGSALWGHGKNSFSQLGLDTIVDQAVEVSIDVNKVISMAGGLNHSIYVREDGSVWAMGDNTYGQLGTSDTVQRTTPVQVLSGGAIQVAAGDYHSLIVMRNGSLWAMGRNDEGQLGDGTQFNRNYPTFIENTGVVMADGGTGHSVFLKSNGSVWVMGRGVEGQLGNGSTSGTDGPIMAYNGTSSSATFVAAGRNHTLFQTNDTSLWGMGDNTYGQLGLISSIITQLNPTIVASSVKKVAAGAYHSMYTSSSGSLYLTGNNSNGQLGNGDTGRASVYGFTLLSGYNNVKEIGAGTDYSIFMSDTSMYAMGNNGNGQFGNGTFASLNLIPVVLPHTNVANGGMGAGHLLFTKRAPERIKIFGLDKVLAGEEAQFLAFQEYDNGDHEEVTDSASWSEDHVNTSIDTFGRLLIGGGTEGQQVNVSATFGAFNDSMLVNIVAWQPQFGNLKGLGRNDNYQLGDSLDTTAHTAAITIDSEVVMVASGMNYTMYIKTDGSLWGMGDNLDGQLGTGDSVTRTVPTMILPADVIKVACGQGHTMFIKNDGSLWGMGANTYGQLGNGQIGGEHSPIMIEKAGIVEVACGMEHTLFVRKGGSLMAMGNNSQGQLGEPMFEVMQSDRPLEVVYDGVTAIAAGSTHTLYVRNGALYTMGNNSSGQLGNGQTGSDVDYPQQIISSGIIDVAAGGSFSLYLRNDNVLFGMGDNNSGQLGQGATSNAEPTPLTIEGGVTRIAAGMGFASWTNAAKNLRSCGSNAYGQIGTGIISASVDTPFTTDPGPTLEPADGGDQSFYLTPTVVSIMVSGPANVNETDTALYMASATWSDSSVTDVSTSAAWGIDLAGSFTGNTLTTNAVSSNTAAIITATFGGKNDTFPVTVLNVPQITSITVAGPANVNETDTALYTATANLDDSSTMDVSSLASWSINTGGTFSGNTLTTSAVSSDTAAIITASYGGHNDTHNLTIVNVPVVVSIAISGSTTVSESSTAIYTATATLDDTSTMDVSSLATWSINTGGTFTLNTLNTGLVSGDTAAVITASYGGQTDTHNITIIDSSPVITAVTITGPSTVTEQGTTAFTATATWSNSLTTDVSTLATWSIDTGGSFTSNVLSTIDVAVNTPATITVNYSGQVDTYAILIQDLTATLVSIAITGPTTVYEGKTAAYLATATWSDSSISDISGLATWSIDTSGTFAANVLTASTVASDTTATITASYGGQIDTQAVTIGDIIISSIKVFGPGAVAEDDTATYDCIALYTDSSQMDVTDSSLFSIDLGGTFVGDTLTTDTTLSDVAATITATYTSFTATKAVTILNVPGIMTGIRILGPDNVNESSSATFQCIADFSDGTTLNVTNAAIWSESSSYSTIDANDGTLTTASVIGDWPTLISVAHAGFNAVKAVRIIDVDPMAMIYVNKLASSTVKNGTSWSNAFNELRNAMLKAGPGTEIWVAAGTYTPDAGNNRLKTFGLTINMKIYGGFTGIETAVGQRNYTANPTILSGDIGQIGNRFDNSFHVVVGANGATIDGFIIRDGRAQFTQPPQNASGSGSAEPVVDPVEQMTPYFVPVYFDVNDVGGGMINDGVSPTVRNCKFTSNDALYGGGGMYNQNNTTVIEDCTFTGNHSDKWGGAMFNTDNATPTITRTTFMANNTNVSGGALMSSAGAAPVITRCYFKQNSAGRDGGAAISNYSTISFTNCVFWKNHANNHAGAVINNDSTPTFTHCTFTENSAGVSGGAFESNRSTVTVTNSIVWGNHATQMPAFHPRWESMLVLNDCVIDDINLPGTGIINSSPVFTDAALGDLTLQFGSPAIDAGTGAESVDITGGSRDGSPDIGAYEYSSGGVTPPPGGGTGTGGTGGGTTTPITTTGGSSGGGGCALGIATPGMMLPLLMALAGLAAFRRRRKGE